MLGLTGFKVTNHHQHIMKVQDKGIKEVPNGKGVHQEASHLGVLYQEMTKEMEQMMEQYKQDMEQYKQDTNRRLQANDRTLKFCTRTLESCLESDTPTGYAPYTKTSKSRIQKRKSRIPIPSPTRKLPTIQPPTPSHPTLSPSPSSPTSIYPPATLATQTIASPMDQSPSQPLPATKPIQPLMSITFTPHTIRSIKTSLHQLHTSRYHPIQHPTLTPILPILPILSYLVSALHLISSMLGAYAPYT